MIVPLTNAICVNMVMIVAITRASYSTTCSSYSTGIILLSSPATASLCLSKLQPNVSQCLHVGPNQAMSAACAQENDRLSQSAYRLCEWLCKMNSIVLVFYFSLKITPECASKKRIFQKFPGRTPGPPPIAIMAWPLSNCFHRPC